MLKDKQFQQALKKIAQYLNLRSHSLVELKQKLSKKFPPNIVEKALNQAKQNNWLENPLQLSQKIVEELHRKNKSWTYIQSYLKKKNCHCLLIIKKTSWKKRKGFLKNTSHHKAYLTTTF